MKNSTKSSQQISNDSQERIYQSAARLFAQKGYAGTSIRDIAADVSLSVSTINYHVGSKEALYYEILRRTYLMEHHLLSPLMENVEDDVVMSRDGLRRIFRQFIDLFLKRIADEPDTYRVWAFHFLEESKNDLEKMDREFSLPFYQMALNLLQRARQANAIRMDDETMRLFVISTSWLLHGYFNGRKNDWGDTNYDPYLPANLEGFKRYLSLYIDLMIGSPVGDLTTFNKS